jgi:LysM repeat protein
VRVISTPEGWERYQSIPWVKYVHPNRKKLKAAQALVRAGELRPARDIITSALSSAPRSPVTRELRDLLGEINTRIFFSSQPSRRKTEYVVQRGDALSAIARKLKSSADAIMRVNNLDSTAIRAGDTLTVPRLDFTITIDLPRERVLVHDGHGFFTQYPIVSADLPPLRKPVIQTTVAAKAFFLDGEPAPPGFGQEKQGSPWIYLLGRGCVLYGVDEESDAVEAEITVVEKPEGKAASPEAPAANRPPRGIAMLKEDISELEILIRKGTPVTIVLDREK